MKKVIINKKVRNVTIDGQPVQFYDAMLIVLQHLMKGSAKEIERTEDYSIYELIEGNPIENHDGLLPRPLYPIVTQEHNSNLTEQPT